MDCFTFYEGKIIPGIALEVDRKLGPVVKLGEKGWGRRYAKIPFYRNNPAEIVGGKIRQAHPVKIDIKETSTGKKAFYALAKPNNINDSRILLRINTQWIPEPKTYGGWAIKKNEPDLIISGYGAHGKDGELGGWLDSLVILSHGDEVYIKPEGGLKTPEFSVCYDQFTDIRCYVLKAT